MRPTSVSWNYYNREHGCNNGFSSVTCPLTQCQERFHYSLFYSPSLQNNFTLFIVHLTPDITGTMDVISTIIKTNIQKNNPEWML